MDGGIALAPVLPVALAPAAPNAQRTQSGRIDLVFRDGIAYDPTRLRESVRGKIGR